MISYDEAIDIVRGAAKTIGGQRVPLDQLAGRVLAEPISTPYDIPYFDNSAVDGFAFVEVPFVGSPVKLVGEVAAGDAELPNVGLGEAAKVATGSRVPSGTCAVAMQEHVSVVGSSVVLNRAIERGVNIRLKGEEMTAGMTVLPAGRLLEPPSVALLASLGMDNALVAIKPKVGVIGTGSELRQPGDALEPGCIFESNRQGVEAAALGYGLDVAFSRHVPDDLGMVEAAIAEASEMCDIIVTCGGASVGGRDFVVEAAEAQGYGLHFHGVAIKPGKPTFFMNRGHKLLFGMPGNPVPALLGFELFVRPALLRLLGMPDDRDEMATIMEALSKEPGRAEFVRATLTINEHGMVAHPIERRGSHMLGGLSNAEAVFEFPAAETRLRVGQRVRLVRLRWRLAP